MESRINPDKEDGCLAVNNSVLEFTGGTINRVAPISYRSTYKSKKYRTILYCTNQKNRDQVFQISTRLSKLLKFTSIYQICNWVNFDSISNWKQWDPGGNCGYYNWHNQLFNAIRILYYTRSCGTLRVLLSCRVFVDRQLCCSTQSPSWPSNDLWRTIHFEVSLYIRSFLVEKKTRPYSSTF